MRVAIAYHVILFGVGTLGGSDSNQPFVRIGAGFAIVVGIALLVGMFTPIASALTMIGCLIAAASPWLLGDANSYLSPSPAVDMAALSLALVFLGPGAFSVDARLFGRREIIIPDVHRPPQP